MTRTTCFGVVLAAWLSAACAGIDDDTASATSDDDVHPASPEETPLRGTPCAYRHGVHTVKTRIGSSDAAYHAATFSFEVGSNDAAVTLNDVDVLFEQRALVVNTVVDDRSFIVDLGPVALRDVPPTVDAADFPVGRFGEHDVLPAVLGHTYVVRTVDGNTRQWAAFSIVALSIDEEMTIEWIRSPAPELLQVPSDCL